ncbi:MAG: hypothetical protein ABGY11_07430 [Candidatus Thioglobus sp.]
MALGALLNSLASMTSSLSSIGNIMSSLGSAASKIGEALGKAFSFAKKKAKQVFDEIKDAFESLTVVLKLVWNATVIPMWSLMKTAMMFWVNLFSGEWGKALDNVKTIWGATFGKLWSGLKSAAGKALGGIKTLWGVIVGTMGTIFDATIGNAFDKLKSAAQGVFDTIGSAWDTVTSVMSTIYDKTLGRIFDAIGGALKGIFNFGRSVVGGVAELGSGAINAVTGGSGDSDSPSSGGNTFNMTFNLSGLTDRTDKRELAREISDLIQQELSRSSGGGGRIGRGY